MATVTLGNIKFNWKGPYNNSTAYVVDDVVSSGGSSYICILASQGNAVSNGTYWQQMSAAGTNGTDVGTTITTQGDILYRDGSGLQRLGAGTSGYYLKTQGTGANPVWAEAGGGDFVKLASTNVTSDTTEVDFLSAFSTDYEFYTIYVSIYPSTTGSNINFRAITGTNSVDSTGGSYYQMGNHNRMSTGASNDNTDKYGSNSHGEIYLTYPAGNGAGTGQGYGAFGVVEIARPWDSSNSKWGHIKMYYRDNSNKVTLIQGAFTYLPTTAMTGFRLYGSTFNRGRVTLYGHKH